MKCISDSARTNETVTQTTHHLTSYTEAVGVTSQKKPSVTTAWPRQDPYPNAEIERALTRDYQVSQSAWTAANVTGDLIFNLDAPNCLYSKTYIKEKLKFYRYMRSDVVFTIRMSATTFEYGSLLVGWLPYVLNAPTTDYRFADIWNLSKCNGQLLSVSENETMEIRVPMVNPHLWMPLDSALPFIGTIVCRVFQPLKTTSPDPPANIQIIVSARFENIEVAGFSPATSVPDPLAIKAIYRAAEKRKENLQRTITGETQSNPIAREAEAKTEGGTISDTLNAVTSLAPIIGLVAPELTPITTAVMTLGPAISSIFKAGGLDKPAALGPTAPTVMRHHADLQYTRGLDNVPKLSLDPDYQVATKKGLCGPGDPQPSLLDMMKLPSLYKTGSFSNTTAVGAVITNFPVNPCTIPVITTGATYRYYAPTYLYHYASQFKYWRGTLKYMIRFTASKFMKTRVRITHLPTDIAVSYASVSGDIISKVYDITGDTTVTFAVPYIALDAYSLIKVPSSITTSNNENGLITLSLYNPIASPDTSTDPPVYYSIWIAAGDDFRVSRYLGNANGWTTQMITYPLSVAEEDAVQLKKINKKNREKEVNSLTQIDPTAIFKVGFEGLAEAHYSVEAGVVTGEDAGGVLDLCKRYHRCRDTITASASNYVRLYPNVTNGASTDPISYLLSPFQFWRGSTRFRYVTAQSYINAVDASDLTAPMIRADSISAGLLPFPTNVFPDISCELPFYSKQLFYETQFNMDVPSSTIGLQTILFYAASATLTYPLWCVGDDFSVGSIQPPPVLRTLLAAEEQPAEFLTYTFPSQYEDEPYMAYLREKNLQSSKLI